MRRSSYRTLIDHGRKAGVRTSEMYAALSSERLAPDDGAGQTDGNGVSVAQDGRGYLVFTAETADRPT